MTDDSTPRESVRPDRGRAMWRAVAKFPGRGSDGHGYTLVVLTEYAPGPDRGAEGAAAPTGRHEVRTADGLAVTCTGPGEFRVDRTGVSVRSDDPAARALGEAVEPERGRGP